jgi:hypothetical protein
MTNGRDGRRPPCPASQTTPNRGSTPCAVERPPAGPPSMVDDSTSGPPVRYLERPHVAPHLQPRSRPRLQYPSITSSAVSVSPLSRCSNNNIPSSRPDRTRRATVFGRCYPFLHHRHDLAIWVLNTLSRPRSRKLLRVGRYIQQKRNED